MNVNTVRPTETMITRKNRKLERQRCKYMINICESSVAGSEGRKREVNSRRTVKDDAMAVEATASRRGSEERSKIQENTVKENENKTIDGDTGEINGEINAEINLIEEGNSGGQETN